MGSSDIQNILVEITNKLVSKGYITSIATVSDKNDLTTGTLNLKVVAGKIEDVRINSGNGLDKYKEFFYVFLKTRRESVEYKRIWILLRIILTLSALII